MQQCTKEKWKIVVESVGCLRSPEAWRSRVADLPSLLAQAIDVAHVAQRKPGASVLRAHAAASSERHAEIKATYYQKFRKSAQGGDDDEGEPGAPPPNSPRKRAAEQAASTPSRKSPRLNAAA